MAVLDTLLLNRHRFIPRYYCASIVHH